MPHGFISLLLLMEYDYLITHKISLSPVSFHVIVCIFRVPYNEIIQDRQLEARIPSDKFNEIGQEELLKRLYQVFWNDMADPSLDNKYHLIPASLIIPELENDLERVVKCKEMMSQAASESDEDDESEASETSDDQTTEHKEV